MDTTVVLKMRHHVEEEERDWFPRVRKAKGRKRLVESADDLTAAKPQAPADPVASPSATV